MWRTEDLALAGYRILLVDDHLETLEALSLCLELAGAHVTCASSGQEAMGRLVTMSPDVVLSDLSMPDIDGHELLRRIRATERETGKRIPAIAVTADSRPETRQTALQSGFDHFVSKPVDLGAVIEAVLRALPRGIERAGERVVPGHPDDGAAIEDAVHDTLVGLAPRKGTPDRATTTGTVGLRGKRGKR